MPIGEFPQLTKRADEIKAWLKEEYSGLRTGRANVAVLDSVKVDSYGSLMPINQVANVAVEDAKTIRIVPWDQSQTKNIEKAIVDSNLGLSVNTDDKGLRVIFPELTSERREQLIKVAKQKLEDARISLRQERDEVWDDIQKQEKDGDISEDDKFRMKDEMQKIVDDTQKVLEEMAQKKETEITS